MSVCLSEGFDLFGSKFFLLLAHHQTFTVTVHLFPGLHR